MCMASHTVQDKHTNMLCFLLMLLVIASCGAQELTTSEQDQNETNGVELPNTSESRIIGGSATTIAKYPFIVQSDGSRGVEKLIFSNLGRPVIANPGLLDASQGCNWNKCQDADVQVLYLNHLRCGGSLVTRRHVLSASHCFVEDNGSVDSPLIYSIRAGSTYLNYGGAIYYVSAIIVHEDYDRSTSDNDVAIMLLNSQAALTSSVQPVLLPAAGEDLPDNTTVVAVGWGKTNVSLSVLSSVLQEVSVRTVNQDMCVYRYQYLENITGDKYTVTDNMLCAGLLDVGGADSCQGDSGGPLVHEGTVVGITSWGASCGLAPFPGVYTRVNRFSNWINETLVKYSDAPRSHLVSATTLLIPLLFVMISV